MVPMSEFLHDVLYKKARMNGLADGKIFWYIFGDFDDCDRRQTKTTAVAYTALAEYRAAIKHFY